MPHPNPALGIGLALAALLMAGLNDLVFRRAAMVNGNSIGLYIAAAGGTWTLLMIAYLLFSDPDLLLGSWSGPDRLFGFLCGFTLAYANILLVESMKILPASTGSTIYRMNTALVVLGGCLLLGEPLDALKLGGVASGLIAVMVLYCGSIAAASAAAAIDPNPGTDGTGHLQVELSELLGGGSGSEDDIDARIEAQPLHEPAGEEEVQGREQQAVQESVPSEQPDTDPAQSTVAAPDDNASLVDKGESAESEEEGEPSTGMVESTQVSSKESDAGAVRLRYGMLCTATVLRASYGLLAKDGISHGADANLLVLCGALGWVLGGGLWAGYFEGVSERWSSMPWGPCLRYGGLSGVLTCGNILSLTLALREGDASALVPIANSSFLCTLALSVAAGMEVCDRYKGMAAGAALLCITLLALSSLHSGE